MVRRTLGLRRGAMIVLAGLVVSACGGGSDSASAPAAPSLSQEAEEMQERLDRLARFNTGFTGQPGQMPTTGTAAFNGFAGIDVAGATPMELTGRATLTVDFAALTLAGSATGFEGAAAGRRTPYAGTIEFTGGTIGRSAAVPGSVPNDIRFRYEGQLSAPGTTVVVGADATGKFRGTPIRGMVAASTGGATVNGVATPAPFALVAEIQP